MKEWFYKTERNWRTGKRERKFNWEKVAGIFIALFAIAFIMFFVIEIPKAGRNLVADFALAAQREAKCMAAGYSEVRITNYGLGQVYCYKIENGTEVLTPIERVE